MNNTRYWLVRIYLKMPEEMSLEGVLFDRLMKAPADWTVAQVLKLAKQFVNDWYADSDVTGSVVKMKNVDKIPEDIVRHLMVVDLGDKSQTT